MAEPIKKILVTGANGFIGKNLISVLQRREGVEIFPADVETTEEEWDKYCKECDFVMHLAGVNRPKEVSEFMEGNFGLTTKLLALLKKHKNLAPVLLTSSVQAVLDNDYGKARKRAKIIFCNTVKKREPRRIFIGCRTCSENGEDPITTVRSSLFVTIFRVICRLQ